MVGEGLKLGDGVSFIVGEGVGESVVGEVVGVAVSVGFAVGLEVGVDPFLFPPGLFLR